MVLDLFPICVINAPIHLMGSSELNSYWFVDINALIQLTGCPGYNSVLLFSIAPIQLTVALHSTLTIFLI